MMIMMIWILLAMLMWLSCGKWAWDILILHRLAGTGYGNCAAKCVLLGPLALLAAIHGEW